MRLPVSGRGSLLTMASVSRSRSMVLIALVSALCPYL
jgi:hypothetical protein